MLGAIAWSGTGMSVYAERAAVADSATESVEEIPPGPKVYLGRRIAHTMHWMGAKWLTRTEREREEATSTMMRELALKPGMMVADVGCGNGYHTLMVAEAVGPKGKVWGSDIQPEMLELLEKRAKEAGVTNVVTVAGSYVDPKLPKGKLDLVILADAYHEFSHPVQMLSRIRESLKSDGRIMLLEFRSEDDSVPIKKDHKMSKAQITKEMTANGFEFDRSYDKLPWQHMMFFKRTPDTP